MVLQPFLLTVCANLHFIGFLSSILSRTEMGEGFKFWFMVPFILVTGFASVLVIKGSIWVFDHSHPYSKTGLNSVKIPALQAKQRVGLADFHSEVISVDGHSREEAFSNETAINHSVSSPIFADPLQGQHTVMDLPLKPRRRRFGTSLERLEAGLRRARAAIKEAMNGSRLQDPDYSPDGPIYRNAKVFHRSYLEMEKRFKIYVYKEGEVPLFHNGPCMMIYSIEGQFINKMEMNKRFRTHNPEKAHVFFLPFSIVKMRHFVTQLDSFGRIVIDYVNLVAEKHWYWNRSHGADHFMLSCHDWGPKTSFFVPDMAKRSIRALCNANTSERFNPKKDVSIPEISLRGSKLEGLIGGPSPSKRSILAFFAGGNHGPIRPILLEHWEKKDRDVQVYNYLPRRVSYNDLMRKSKYCLCPSGYEVASPRVVESLYNGCVPVLISKNYVPPFGDVLNWKMFSVTVSVEDIPNLKKILMSIPERRYIRMQKRVVQVRRHFELNSPPKRFDVFHMILHSIWLRRLNVRIGDIGFEQSSNWS